MSAFCSEHLKFTLTGFVRSFRFGNKKGRPTFEVQRTFSTKYHERKVCPMTTNPASDMDFNPDTLSSWSLAADPEEPNRSELEKDISVLLCRRSLPAYKKNNPLGFDLTTTDGLVQYQHFLRGERFHIMLPNKYLASDSVLVRCDYESSILANCLIGERSRERSRSSSSKEGSRPRTRIIRNGGIECYKIIRCNGTKQGISQCVQIVHAMS